MIREEVHKKLIEFRNFAEEAGIHGVGLEICECNELQGIRRVIDENILPGFKDIVPKILSQAIL